MNIIFGKDATGAVSEKYIVLELDSVKVPGLVEVIPAYCLLDAQKIPLTEVVTLDQFRDLHTNLIKNYRLQNWKYCTEAIDHLKGKWSGELDSFYTMLLERIEEFKITPPGPEWDWTISGDTSIASV